jgi:hypothetical protein
MKESAIGSKVASSELGRFVSEQNIIRYRTLLDTRTDEETRRMIIRLMADELGKVRID